MTSLLPIMVVTLLGHLVFAAVLGMLVAREPARRLRDGRLLGVGALYAVLGAGLVFGVGSGIWLVWQVLSDPGLAGADYGSYLMLTGCGFGPPVVGVAIAWRTMGRRTRRSLLDPLKSSTEENYQRHDTEVD